MHDDDDVRYFPRMSKELRAIARSGRTLFGQYRMLEATHTPRGVAPIIVDHGQSLVESWIPIHLSEMWETFREDEYERYARGMDASVGRAMKKLDKFNKGV